MNKAVLGFTLIELSVVLVIVGLIVGGVLVGRDLVAASEVRSVISQIEKYQTAVNTFRGKYGYLPGDIKDPEASQFGFPARGQYAGEGDGNGKIEGVAANAPNSNCCAYEQSGETTMFWVDLSAAHLIDGGFTAGSPTVPSELTNDVTLTSSPHKAGDYFPEAKIGKGNIVWVWSSLSMAASSPWAPPGPNYFSISANPGIYGFNSGVYSRPGLTVAQAYSIDKKIDDGLPQSGGTLAIYIVYSAPFWVAGGATTVTNGVTVQAAFGEGDGTTGGPVTPGDGIVTAGTAGTCYDNGNSGGATERYSVGMNSSTLNCALSFRFQ
jgi:prepilin-type N-terminal cleavage/methylation domain-containing protein